MAWNEPGGNKDKDPWGNNDQGPPDLDEAFKNLRNNVTSLFGGGRQRPGSGGGSGLNRGLLAVAVAIVLIAWGLLGVYTVDQAERGVVLRLGKKLDEVVMPGLRWNPPLIDERFIVNVEQVRSIAHDAEMLTEDENIVRVNMKVQYKIGNIQDYVLLVNNPENSLRQAMESALRHVVGSSEMHGVLTEGRAELAIDVEQRLQGYIDTYGTGLQIEQVIIEDTQPPEAVKEAFDDVIKAREDEQRFRNEADAYANKIVPEARGEAARQIEEANGYREQVIAQANGEAERFNKLYAEYELAPEVTRQRLYLDSLESVMKNSTKVMVDVDGGNNLLYLPLDKLVQQSPATTTGRGVNVDDRIRQGIIDELNRRNVGGQSRSRR
ncbi:MAG: FtsH protease activity modulator HflK [Gammaproteobacteria bacterium]|mgnify:CR=1 FL=1|nr:FtsH protease activity modulator HflK [Gammaproteobacteria bacterium]MBJ40138.1 FtsH protease activity modulator HflK [Gammaproteobacteria bacterium]